MLLLLDFVPYFVSFAKVINYIEFQIDFYLSEWIKNLCPFDFERINLTT